MAKQHILRVRDSERALQTLTRKAIAKQRELGKRQMDRLQRHLIDQGFVSILKRV